MSKKVITVVALGNATANITAARNCIVNKSSVYDYIASATGVSYDDAITDVAQVLSVMEDGGYYFTPNRVRILVNQLVNNNADTIDYTKLN